MLIEVFVRWGALIALLLLAACAGEVRGSQGAPVASLRPIQMVYGGILSFPLESAEARTPTEVLPSEDTLVAPWRAALDAEVAKLRIDDVPFMRAVESDTELGTAWKTIRSAPRVGESDPLPSGQYRVTVEADLVPILRILTARDAQKQG